MTVRTLDTSDIDQYLGKPITSSRIREPIANNDIRRWAHAMHYPNLLHYDPTFAEGSRWGKIVGPQSFSCAMDDGMGTSPACVGGIPNSHLLFGRRREPSGPRQASDDEPEGDDHGHRHGGDRLPKRAV